MVAASMVEPVEKSTEAIRQLVWKNDQTEVMLDSRLALVCEAGQWLVVSDLHYGYEVRRRAGGGLWPMWGRRTIESRLEELLSEYQPRTLILNGDIVDGASSGQREVIRWIHELMDGRAQLVLIKGNHDRGALLREFDFVDQYQTDGFLFHHGHESVPVPEGVIEVIGHIHPAYRFSDGAGLSMKLPTFVCGSGKWVMPAFSPWAGGVNLSDEDDASQTWACSPKRIFQVNGASG